MKCLALLAALAASLYGAASVQQSTNQLGTTNTYVTAFRWTAASDGTVPVTAANSMANCCQGYIITQVEVVPGTPAPTNGYSVAVLSSSGVDALGGGASACSSTAAQSFAAAASAAPIQGAFSLSITGQNVNGARGSVLVYMSKPGTVNLATLNQNSNTGVPGGLAAEVPFQLGSGLSGFDQNFGFDKTNHTLNLGFGGRASLGFAQNGLNVAVLKTPASDIPIGLGSIAATFNVGTTANPIDNPPGTVFLSQFGGPGTQYPGPIYGANMTMLNTLQVISPGARVSPIVANLVLDDQAGLNSGTFDLAAQPVVINGQLFTEATAGFGQEWNIYDVGRNRFPAFFISRLNGNLTNVVVAGANMTVNMTVTNASLGIQVGTVVNLMGFNLGANNLDNHYTVSSLVGGSGGTAFVVPNTNGAGNNTYTDTYSAMLVGAIHDSTNVLYEGGVWTFANGPNSVNGGIVLSAEGYYPTDFAIRINELANPKALWGHGIEVLTKNTSMNILDLTLLTTPDSTTGHFRMQDTGQLEIDMNTAVANDFSTYAAPMILSKFGLTTIGIGGETDLTEQGKDAANIANVINFTHKLMATAGLENAFQMVTNFTNIGAGTELAQTQFTSNVNGALTTALTIAGANVTMAGTVTVSSQTHTAAATCWKAGGTLGYCSTTVGAGGTCTCN